jgi:hypothetical protein
MDMSTSINELAAALAKAQGQITGALKDSSNPFFKSKYADLAACWDACRKPLSDHGLAVIQTTAEKDGHVYVVTTLAHSSGQWMRGWLPVKTKDDSPQGQGSGLTYSRRYALAGIVGLAQIDDDAEAAQGRTKISVIDHGEQVTAKQAADAKSFARDFQVYLESDDDEATKTRRIYELSREADEDAIVKMEAWKLLNSKERAAIKKYLELAKKEAA